jgi:chaperonin GroES
MAIKPLDDRVVVEELEAESVTAGGIVLPETAKEKPQQGKIIAAGPGRMLESGERAPMCVAVGDVVILSRYGGDKVEIDGKDCRIMRETDILAVVG